jgi:hypothetical protein
MVTSVRGAPLEIHHEEVTQSQFRQVTLDSLEEVRDRTLEGEYCVAQRQGVLVRAEVGLTHEAEGLTHLRDKKSSQGQKRVMNVSTLENTSDAFHCKHGFYYILLGTLKIYKYVHQIVTEMLNDQAAACSNKEQPYTS